MDDEKCTRCGRSVPPYEGVHQSDGKGGDLGFVCGRCWSDIVSAAAGVDVGHVELEPVVLLDATGRKHEFHFRFIPAPRGIEAFEVIDGVRDGYQFQVLQESDDPAIVSKLMEKMRRGLAQQHLEPSPLEPERWSIKDLVVRGRVEWDEAQEGLVPRVVVDGRSLSWFELGAMLMSFEGWQFRLDLIDPCDEP